MRAEGVRRRDASATANLFLSLDPTRAMRIAITRVRADERADDAPGVRFFGAW